MTKLAGFAIIALFGLPLTFVLVARLAGSIFAALAAADDHTHWRE